MSVFTRLATILTALDNPTVNICFTGDYIVVTGETTCFQLAYDVHPRFCTIGQDYGVMLINTGTPNAYCNVPGVVTVTY